MVKTEKKETPIKNLINYLFGDLVIWYIVLIMMSIMYHYRSSLTFVYGLAALIITVVCFKIFDYIARHKFVGSGAYIAVFMLFMAAARYCIGQGALEYPISFGIWFLTPQDALDYSRWYTMAMFLLFMIFTVSVVYYFTKIRYRVFMNFLIFIIPFALYGKEYEKMPTIYIILLAVGYVAVMIKFRQIAENEKTVIIRKSSLWKSAAVFIVIFASAASIVPKPEIEADRTILEQMISADQFTDRLMEALGVFRDTSTGEQFRSFNDDSILYFGRSEEPLRLKTTTFSTYNYENDGWEISVADKRFRYTSEEKPITSPETGKILKAVAQAAEKDAYFAEKYGLEDFSADNLTEPATKKTELYCLLDGTTFAPVPTSLVKMNKPQNTDEIALIRSGLVYCVDDRFRYGETFSFEYSSNNFFSYPENKALADLMCRDDYYDLIYDAAISINNEEPELSEFLIDNWKDSLDADVQLDYGKNAKIYNLACEITNGLNSDYEKAIAIEKYFTENNYVYDLNYQKGKGDNAEDFIFSSKRGVCYEFATAMVLLSRAAGIPARYCEGYNMYEPYDNDRLGTNYVIKTKSAHGFPELYIRGVGWISFEPTVASSESMKNGASTTSSLAFAGILVIAAALLFLLAVKLFPTISHKFFLMRIKKFTGEEYIVRIMKRICSLLKISSVNTSHETAELVKEKCGVNIESTAELFDRTVYGGTALSETEMEAALNDYIAVYRAIQESEKRKIKRTGELN
ncbi:MAG: transglutaminase family protein [Ruminococcus sp.]